MVCKKLKIIMRKHVFIIALLALSSLMLLNAWNPKGADNEGIQFFEGSWEEVLQKSEVENKPIFLDIYATWCGPCKKLKQDTFSDKEVGAYFNANFINVTLDGEQGDGLVLARKYRVQGYPTMLFIGPEGSVKRHVLGYHNPEQLIRLAQEVQK